MTQEQKDNIESHIIKALIDFEVGNNREPKFIVMHSSTHDALCERLSLIRRESIVLTIKYMRCRVIKSNDVLTNELLIG